ncbi:MAG: hypothetical protein ACLQUY_15815 [Ktedonobacterales bacterium]
MSLPLLLGALTLVPALCALLIAGLGAARLALKPVALSLGLAGLLVPVVLLLVLVLGAPSGNPLFVGLFGGSAGINDWFSAVYRIDGLGIYAAFGITVIIAPLLLWTAWTGAEIEVGAEQPSWATTPLARTQWGGVALALGIESSALTVVLADNIIWLALGWLILALAVWGIGELGSDLATVDRIGLILMLIGPLLWVLAMLVPATGQHGNRSIYPRLADMMGRSGLPPLQVLILAVALALAGAGYPFLAWIRRRALLVTPAGLVALVLVFLPVALLVGARTYSAAQDGNSSWLEIGQTAPPITAGIWFSVLGMLTICISGLLALGRRDSRTLIAFLAVAQVGWGFLALGAGNATSMLGLVVLLATGLLGLGAMLASLFTGGTLTSDVEPDGAGPRSFGVPVQPLSLGAWIAGALTVLGAPLFGGFVATQMISASIMNGRGLAVPLLGTAWAGDALLALALVRATAPAFTVFVGNTYHDDQENVVDEKLDVSTSTITTLLPMAPATLLAVLAILVGAVPQILLRIGGLPAASALVQAGATNAALVTSTIGYHVPAAQWLPTIAWLAIIVLAVLLLFALPASLRETKPIFLAGLEAPVELETSSELEPVSADEPYQAEISAAELAYLPEPAETWSDLDAAFTSPWLLPLGELLLAGIDDDYQRQVENVDDIALPDSPEEAVEEPISTSRTVSTSSSKPAPAPKSAEQDRSADPSKSTSNSSEVRLGSLSRNARPAAGESKKAGPKKGDKGGGR